MLEQTVIMTKTSHRTLCPIASISNSSLYNFFMMSAILWFWHQTCRMDLAKLWHVITKSHATIMSLIFLLRRCLPSSSVNLDEHGNPMARVTETPILCPYIVQIKSTKNIGLLMFLIALSIHFEVNLILAISVAILITGILATSTLYLKAHTAAEVFIGLTIGAVSQLLTLKFWL